MASTRHGSFTIVTDSREQAPWSFDSSPLYSDTSVTVGKLESGDYSVKGLESVVAIERKALPDLIACLGRERPRFERELERSRGLEFFGVVVESDFQSVAKGQYRSMLSPHSACQSICAWTARWGVNFFFAGSRAAGEYVAWSLLKQFVEGKRKQLAAVERALGSPAGACARGMDNHKASEPEDVLDAFGASEEASPEGREERQ